MTAAAAKDGGSAIIGKSSDKSINQENVLRKSGQ